MKKWNTSDKIINSLSGQESKFLMGEGSRFSFELIEVDLDVLLNIEQECHWEKLE